MSPACGLSEPRLASHLGTRGGPLPGPSGTQVTQFPSHFPREAGICRSLLILKVCNGHWAIISASLVPLSFCILLARESDFSKKSLFLFSRHYCRHEGVCGEQVFSRILYLCGKRDITATTQIKSSPSRTRGWKEINKVL